MTSQLRDSPQWKRVSSRVNNYLEEQNKKKVAAGKNESLVRLAMIIEEHGSRPRTTEGRIKAKYCRTPLKKILLYEDLERKKEFRRKMNRAKMREWVKKQEALEEGNFEQKACDELFLPYGGPDKNRDEKKRTNWMLEREFHP